MFLFVILNLKTSISSMNRRPLLDSLVSVENDVSVLIFVEQQFHLARWLSTSVFEIADEMMLTSSYRICRLVETDYFQKRIVLRRSLQILFQNNDNMKCNSIYCLVMKRFLLMIWPIRNWTRVECKVHLWFVDEGCWRQFHWLTNVCVRAAKERERRSYFLTWWWFNEAKNKTYSCFFLSRFFVWIWKKRKKMIPKQNNRVLFI